MFSENATQSDPIQKNYHCPQIGVFITSFVRIIVRETALLKPEIFLYADTDCVAFSENIDHLLDINPTRYGAWKKEVDGKEYMLIGKKVYKDMDGSEQKAKGLRSKELSRQDYMDWFYKDKIPEQHQLQRNNFLKFSGGSDMFKKLDRKGTDLRNLKNVEIISGHFTPKKT